MCSAPCSAHSIPMTAQPGAAPRTTLRQDGDGENQHLEFLGMHISENLSWAQHTDAITKNAHQSFNFLRRLKRFSMSNTLLNLKVYSREHINQLDHGLVQQLEHPRTQRLQRVVDIDKSIMETDCPAMKWIYRRRYLKKTVNAKVPHHPSYGRNLLLPLGRWYTSLKTDLQVQEQFLPSDHQTLEHDKINLSNYDLLWTVLSLAQWTLVLHYYCLVTEH